MYMCMTRSPTFSIGSFSGLSSVNGRKIRDQESSTQVVQLLVSYSDGCYEMNVVLIGGDYLQRHMVD